MAIYHIAVELMTTGVVVMFRVVLLVTSFQVEKMKSPSIFIVEDDLVTRELLVSCFEKAGFKVHEAGNGEEVWQVLEIFRDIDVFLLDINHFVKDC